MTKIVIYSNHFIGSLDHIIPSALNQNNFEAYKDKASVREIRIFPGRDHNICAGKGWEEVAAFVYDWLVKTKLVD